MLLGTLSSSPLWPDGSLRALDETLGYRVGIDLHQQKFKLKHNNDMCQHS